MPTHTVRLVDASDIDCTIQEIRRTISGWNLSQEQRDSLGCRSEDMIREFANRGQQLSAIHSTLTVSQRIREGDYTVEILVNYGLRRLGVMSRFLSLLGMGKQ